MKEVAHLDEQVRQMTVEREEHDRASQRLHEDQQAAENASSMASRLVASMEEQLRLARSEREEMTRQHASDKEFLSGIFRELEARATRRHPPPRGPRCPAIFTTQPRVARGQPCLRPRHHTPPASFDRPGRGVPTCAAPSLAAGSARHRTL